MWFRANGVRMVQGRQFRANREEEEEGERETHLE